MGYGSGRAPYPERNTKFDCAASCAVDYFNPVPDVIFEKGAEKWLGDLARELVKRANRIKGTYDGAKCAAACRKKQKCDK
jgi:hypothetical protein